MGTHKEKKVTCAGCRRAYCQGCTPRCPGCGSKRIVRQPIVAGA